MSKVLFLEFNEICPPLLEKWMAAGHLPNFAAHFRASQVFTTVADETDPAYLEPWIQWYSIHTGLPYQEHKVFHLTDGPRAGHADIWQRLHALGKSVMNCSSMNARGIAGEGVFYLPDPWCSTEHAFPRELEPFKQVVSRLVQGYAAGVQVPPQQLVSFVTFLTSHGLKAGTARAILQQLFSERISAKDVKWRRVALLDRIQFDIFEHYYRRMRPDFATFFVNSTAHLQHAYWRHMDPEPFGLKPTEEEIGVYGDAVLFGYRAMDQLLARVTTLVDDETIVILCSALSQQPFLKREDRGGQKFYRLQNPAEFLALAGVRPEQIEPTMTHQYVLRFADEATSERAIAALRGLHIGDTEIFGIEKAGASAIYIGCQIFRQLKTNPSITGIVGRNEPIAFFDAFYPIEGVKSARHHPDGVLWIQTGDHAVAQDKVSILDIMPTIFEFMNVPPDTDLAALKGSSLVPRFGGRTARRVA